MTAGREDVRVRVSSSDPAVWPSKMRKEEAQTELGSIVHDGVTVPRVVRGQAAVRGHRCYARLNSFIRFMGERDTRRYNNWSEGV